MGAPRGSCKPLGRRVSDQRISARAETDCVAGLRGLELRNDGPKYRFEMSRGFSSDSAESGYQRLFAHELPKSDMHPTPWLACDCMPGMKDSKLVSAHDFWKSERLRSGVPELSGY